MRIFFISLLILFAASRVFGNGGITTYSSVIGTGNPTFIDMPDVKLISEKLYIEFDRAYSNIKVKYILWNDSDKDYTDLNYGFPIDYMVGLRDGPPAEWKDSYLKYILFRANGDVLNHTNSPEALYNKEHAVYRKWHYTNISIKKHSFLTLEVEYSVMNGYVIDGHSPLLLADFEWAGSYLLYDFSPASHWGDGIIRDFYIQVDAGALALSGEYGYFPYYFPGEHHTDEDYNTKVAENRVYSQSFDLKKEGNIYTYRARNFDLKNAKPLSICYGYAQDLEYVLSKKLNSDKYNVTVSTETAEYPKTNLTDMNLETAWIAPKGGINEWVEFTFKNQAGVSGFTIVNGYMKSESTYYENNRIKEIQLDIKEKKKEKANTFTFTFEDSEYQPLYFENLIDRLDWIDFFDHVSDDAISIYNNTDSENYIEKVRITILDIYPGTKYNDSCISEILFFE